MNNVDFYSVTPNQYSSLETKDNNALYFLNNGEIYKGETLLSNNVEIIPDDEDYPETGENNKLYAKLNGESAFWNGSSYTLISHSILLQLNNIKNRINDKISSGLNYIAVIQRTITNLSDSNIINIGNSAFQDCKNLTSVILPNVTTIGENAFNGCTSLTSVDFPNVTTIGENAFNGCTSLTSVILPNVTTIGENAFRSIDTLNLILPSSTIATAVGSILGYVSISASVYIYVPDDLVDSYKAATNWKTYKDRIKGMSELSN